MERVLTIKIASDYILKKVNDISAFTQIDDDASVILAKSPIGQLDLSGIKILSDISATELSKFKRKINLSGLESLSDSKGNIAIAKKLAKYKGKLELVKLKTIGDKAAMELANHEGILRLADLIELNDSKGHLALAEKIDLAYGLKLNHLLKLGANAAKTIALRMAFTQNIIHLNALKNPSNKVLKSFSNFLGSVFFNGIEHLDAKKLQILSNYKCYNLSLNGLKNLQPKDAKPLASFKARKLNLDGLIDLSEDVATVLSKYKGCELSLNGLTKLNDKPAWNLAQWGIAIALGRNGYLHLEGLKRLDGTRGNVALARRLVQQQKSGFANKYLSLPLVQLHYKSATALASIDGSLSFPNLTFICDKTAEALGEHQDLLYLNAIKTLTFEAAKGLHKHNRSLSLLGLIDIDEKTANLFANNDWLKVPPRIYYAIKGFDFNNYANPDDITNAQLVNKRFEHILAGIRFWEGVFLKKSPVFKISNKGLITRSITSGASPMFGASFSAQYASARDSKHIKYTFEIGDNLFHCSFEDHFCEPIEVFVKNVCKWLEGQFECFKQHI